MSLPGIPRFLGLWNVKAAAQSPLVILWTVNRGRREMTIIPRYKLLDPNSVELAGQEHRSSSISDVALDH
jgi:hypothetical protein